MNTKIVKMIYNPVAGQRHHRRFSKIVKLLKANFKKLEIPYACKLLFQELLTMNIAPRIMT